MHVHYALQISHHGNIIIQKCPQTIWKIGSFRNNENLQYKKKQTRFY